MKARLQATARFSDDGATYAVDGKFRLWLDIYLHADGRLPTVYKTACGLLMNPSTAKVVDADLVFEKHAAPYLEQMMKESLK